MVIENVREFLKKQSFSEGDTLLLAYSGGADSKALLYALLACKDEFGINLELAHVNHGWRKESDEEESKVSEEADRLGLGLHLHKCSFPDKGNLENVYREKRREFFFQVAQKIKAKAVLLAHHKDDQTETVLKRFLEGSSLSGLSGIKAVSVYGSLLLFRPLLSVRKEDLISFLQNQNLQYFHDETNEDEKYLRARMRKTILPDLENQFGKNISNNLLFFAEQSRELNEYLDRKIAPYYENYYEGKLGSYLDLSGIDISAFDKVELMHLLQSLSVRHNLGLSRSLKLRVFEALAEERTFSLELGEANFLIVDRNRVFFVKPQLFKKWTGSFQISGIGKYFFGGWQITVKKHDVTQKRADKNLGWVSLWKEGVTISLPEGNYSLESLTDGLFLRGKRLNRRWQEQKIPAFLRGSLPLVFDKEGVKGEFLLAESSDLIENGKEVWQVTINI